MNNVIDKNKKIILIAAYGFFPAQNFGGPPVSIDNFCTQMDEYDCYIVTRNHDLFSEKKMDGIEDGWNDRGNCRVMYLADSEYNTKTLKRIMEEIKPDLVYIQTFFQARTFISAALAAKSGNIPVFLATRGELCDGAMKKKYKKIPYIYVLKSVGFFKNMFFQATSEEEYDRILRYLNNNDQRVTILPNFPSVPKRTVENKANNSCGNTLRIVTFARIVPQKNILYACECLKNVTREVEWHLYGNLEDKAYWAECEKVIEGFPKKVHFKDMGAVDHEKVKEVLPEYNVYLLPTRSENFGHSIVEAMYAGCIPVISDQTPWRDLRKKGSGYDIA